MRLLTVNEKCIEGSNWSNTDQDYERGRGRINSKLFDDSPQPTRGIIVIGV